jgi:hypothetical protein
MSYQVECPNNTYMCYNNLINIMSKIKTQQDNMDPMQCSDKFNTDNISTCARVPTSDDKTDDECKNCDYLFENLIKGDTTCQDLFDKLSIIEPDKLKTQIKYNLYQLVHMKAKVQPTRIYGYVDWWKQNIWGANKIQNYIYMVSLLIAFIMFVVFTFKLLENIPIKWVIFTIVVALIVIIVIMVYTTQGVKYKAPLLDSRISDSDKTKYDKIVQANWQGESTGALQLGPSIFTILIILYIILAAQRLFFDDKFQFLGMLGKYIITGIIVALNLFYVFFIPQFIIVGIVLQKILMSSFEINKFPQIDNIIKIFILLGIFILSIIESIAEVKRERDNNIIDPKDNICTTEQNPNISIQYWFILITLVLMFGGNLFSIQYNSVVVKKIGSLETGWGLYMEPFVKFIEQK